MSHPRLMRPFPFAYKTSAHQGIRWIPHASFWVNAQVDKLVRFYLDFSQKFSIISKSLKCLIGKQRWKDTPVPRIPCLLEGSLFLGAETYVLLSLQIEEGAEAGRAVLKQERKRVLFICFMPLPD